MHDPKGRFTGTVDNYANYKPFYPPSLFEVCEKLFDLKDTDVIADIGGGHGVSSELFIRNGNTVYGVEPYDATRQAAGVFYDAYPNFKPINGTAESTGLDDDCLDFLIIGQAFHWIDHLSFEKEALRILKKGGWLLIMWNTRTSATAFDSAYESLCQRFGTDYLEINQMAERAKRLLGKMQEVRLENMQILDLDGLIGRFMASAYAPNPGDETYENSLAELDRIFQEHQIDGRVILNHNTELFYLQI